MDFPPLTPTKMSSLQYKTPGTTPRESHVPFVTIDPESGVVEVSQEIPRLKHGTVMLREATLRFNDDGTLSVSGETMHWGLGYYDEPVEGLEYKPHPDQKLVYHYRYGIIDRLLGRPKTAHVPGGYYLADHTEGYWCRMSKWFVKL